MGERQRHLTLGPREQGRQMVILFRNGALQLCTGSERDISILNPLSIHRDHIQVSGFYRGGKVYIKKGLRCRTV